MTDAHGTRRQRFPWGWLLAFAVVGLVAWALVDRDSQRNQQVLGTSQAAPTVAIANPSPNPSVTPGAPAPGPLHDPRANNAAAPDSQGATTHGVALGPVSLNPLASVGQVVNDSATVESLVPPHGFWLTPVGTVRRMFAVLDQQNARVVQLAPGLMVQVQALVRAPGIAPSYQPNLSEAERRQILAAPYLEVFGIQVIQRSANVQGTQQIYTTPGAPSPGATFVPPVPGSGFGAPNFTAPIVGPTPSPPFGSR